MVRPLADIAAELDVSPGPLSHGAMTTGRWLGRGAGRRKAEQAETRASGVRQALEEEVEILRKAAAFFARGIA